MDFALMSILLFIAQLIRANVRWVQQLFMPTAIIAGFIGLLLGESFLSYIAPQAVAFALPFSDQISSYAYMLVVVLFASLYIGTRDGQSARAMFRQVGDTFTTNMAAEFGGFGVALLVGGGLLVVFAPDVSSTFAILQPAGFIGGHGYAAAIGTTLEEARQSVWLSSEAITIGQTFATIGLLIGVFCGLAAINIGVRKGYTRFITRMDTLPEDIRTGFIKEKDQREIGSATVNPMTIDPLSWHALLILIATGLGYYTYQWLRELIPGIAFPMMCLTMLSGVALQKFLGMIDLQHTVDKRIITRMGSSVTDYLIAFGIASIKISVVIKFAVPLLLMTMIGVGFSLLFLFYVAKRIFHNYWFERGIFVFGWSIGVVAMGVTLLRIVDPNYRSNALNDYGIAYLFIAMIELAIVSILPSIVALSFISGNYWYTLVPGAVMLSICLILLYLTVYRYGLQSSDGSLPRAGEESETAGVRQNRDGLSD
jgi:ESS family glutamate:Na+ symporter